MLNIEKFKTSFTFLRGLTRESEHWGSFRKKFEKRYSPENLFFCDLPGTGKLHSIPPVYNFSTLIDTVRLQILDKNLNNRNFQYRVLVGMSFGGMVACQWLAKYSNDFDAIILINSSASDLSTMNQRMNLSCVRYLLPAVLKLNMEMRERRILQCVSNKKVDEEEVNRWIKIQKNSPVTIKTFLSQLFLASTFSIKKISFSIPTLVIYSSKDRLVSFQASENIANYLNAEKSIHKWAGHDIALDDPDWLLNEILNFSEKNLVL